ncbi:hypothetical protein FRB94_005359 [Tulasnella sp. JGI-2019a]|nr:hypothetical protein FRB94_005359 [Tulasnella sp. JGI-2019a]
MDDYVERATHIVFNHAMKSVESQTLKDIDKADLELLHMQCSSEACLATSSSSARCTRAFTAIAQKHNALLPIYRLPTEVMVKIFEYYVVMERSPHLLELVSVAWAAIVLNSPTLWCYINSYQRRGAYLNSLTRSKWSWSTGVFRGKGITLVPKI